MNDLLDRLLDGDHRALARAITNIENRTPGHRELVSSLYDHTGNAEVIGITGSPGAGKSTLVDKVAERYRDQGLTVGVIAIDPSSPFTGGAVLGDRIRMASNVGDMDVFFRSMSARGSLGGVSIATADAVKALDAFGKDRIIVETVGAGQNEVDIVKTADTVTVLVQPGSGDDVQMLKAGILEIADVFVVNKADLDGADRTVQELNEMLQLRGDDGGRDSTGHHAGHHAESAEAVAQEGTSGRRRSSRRSPPAARVSRSSSTHSTTIAHISKPRANSTRRRAPGMPRRSGRCSGRTPPTS
jgi:LAO/AO transport system kinase